MTHWLTAAALNAATSAPLSRSKYARAFLHPIIRLQDVLYEWTPDRQWEKHVNPRVEPQGPIFWDIQKEMRKRFPFPIVLRPQPRASLTLARRVAANFVELAQKLLEEPC